MKSEGIFQFGGFQIDVLARALRRQDEIVTLNRRAFDVLLYLVQNPGRVLTRDELLKNVWPDTFVDENSLAQSISALRRALEEKPGENSYIVTLPGRGYQFVSAVTAIVPESMSVAPGAAATLGSAPQGVLLQRETVRTSVITQDNEQLSLSGSRNRAARVLAVLVLATVSAAGLYAWRKFHRTPLPTNPTTMSMIAAPAAARRSVAVLGFRNLSGRPEEGWLSTALAEMLSTELVAGEKLRLVSGEDIARTKTDLPLALADTDSLSRDTQQAEAIFRKNGSEAGLADVLDNLGMVYETQGDSPAAEKMQREAVAIFRRLDDKRNMGTALGNVADDRLDQGDLRGALQLYQEARQDHDPADGGYAALANANIAVVHQLQGEHVAARQGFEQSLAFWQKSGQQFYSAYAMWGLGNLLLQDADFSGARKMYEQALVRRIAAGDKVTIAESQIGLADLSLEEGHVPADQDATIHQAIEALQQQKARDDEALAWGMLARTLLAEGKAAAAKDAMQHARSLATKSQNPNIRWQTAITAARIETAEKNLAHSADADAARKELATVITKSRALGYMGTELDARLALVELEMKAGQTTTGRAHLAAIETEAKAKGYNLIAHKAATARG